MLGFAAGKGAPNARLVTFNRRQHLIAANVDAKFDQTGLNARLLQSIDA